MHKSESHQALVDLLRQRRARLAPSEVGLPLGSRRRTPRLRREEVAQLANVGTSWYLWLEQGCDVHPSTQVLESLAQALRLTVNERRHLFLLAGQPLSAPALPPEECVSLARQQMLDDLIPTPACVRAPATCAATIGPEASPGSLFRNYARPEINGTQSQDEISSLVEARFETYLRSGSRADFMLSGSSS